MTVIENDLVVEIDYTLTNGAGEVLDSSKEQGPLVYIHGKDNIIPGLEKELTGKKIGDDVKAVVSAQDAYGLRDETLVEWVKNEEFGESADRLKVGMQFHMQANDGSTQIMKVIELKDDSVLLDGNHPLAGESLFFDVNILSLRAATKEELYLGSLQKESGCCDNKGCC